MTQAAKKEGFRPREGLNRTLKYRSQIKWIRVYMNLIFFAILSNALLFSSLLYFKGQVVQSMVALGLGLAVGAIVFLLTRAKVTPLSKVKYHISNSAIAIELDDTTTPISFDEIANIRFSFLSKLFGWFTISLKDGKKYNFSFLIERSDYILEAIVNYNKNLIPQERFLNYRNLLLHSDHSLARLYGGNIKATAFKYVGYPGIFAVFYWFSGGGNGILSFNYMIFQCTKMFLITFFINLLIGKVIFLSSEAFVQRRNELRLKADPNVRTRDLEFEAKIRQYAYFGHFLFFLTFCVFLMVSIH